MDVKIVDYGYRSITAVPFPLDINKAQRETIEAIPGLGKKRTIRSRIWSAIGGMIGSRVWNRSEVGEGAEGIERNVCHHRWGVRDQETEIDRADLTLLP